MPHFLDRIQLHSSASKWPVRSANTSMTATNTKPTLRLRMSKSLTTCLLNHVSSPSMLKKIKNFSIIRTQLTHTMQKCQCKRVLLNLKAGMSVDLLCNALLIRLTVLRETRMEPLSTRSLKKKLVDSSPLMKRPSRNCTSSVNPRVMNLGMSMKRMKKHSDKAWSLNLRITNRLSISTTSMRFSIKNSVYSETKTSTV